MRSATLSAPAVGLAEEHDVLVSPPAGDDVQIAGAGLHHPGRLDEELAPHQMPVGVVDALEVVEVEEEQAEGSLAVQLALQRLVQVARVVEAGEVVEVGEVLHPREALGVIPGQREVARQVLGGLAQRLGGRLVGHEQGPPAMLAGLAHRKPSTLPDASGQAASKGRAGMSGSSAS
jgi:hypothetical protein